MASNCSLDRCPYVIITIIIIIYSLKGGVSHAKLAAAFFFLPLLCGTESVPPEKKLSRSENIVHRKTNKMGIFLSLSHVTPNLHSGKKSV